VLSKLAPPDPLAAEAAHKRRIAVMEGKLEEANRLYGIEAKNSAELRTKLVVAEQQRRNADLELSEHAAAQLAAERQRNILIAIAVLAGAAFIYVKFFSLSTSGLGKIMTDIRAGTPAIQAIDTYTFPWLQERVRKAYEKNAAKAAAKDAAAKAAVQAAVTP
jgi:hypothetical protein